MSTRTKYKICQQGEVARIKEPFNYILANYENARTIHCVLAEGGCEK
jgi:hypothetical protein